MPRIPELLALEGQYGDITLSCRHRDILRCSVTRHFVSCFRPDGCYHHIPRLYCMSHPEVCIIFKRDRSGAFIGRCFGFWDDGKLKLGKIYGNGIDCEHIKMHLPIEVVPTYGDVYFDGLD